MRKLTIIKLAVLASSAGLLLTACNCFDKGKKEAKCPPSSTVGQASSASQEVASGDETVIPLYEEQIKVGKRTVDAGQVTIRKVVTTETVNQPVQLRRETVVIERDGKTETISGGSSASEPAGATSQSGAGFEEKSYTIQLQKEEPVIEKNIVKSGQVVARKSSQTEQQTVQQQVRKENIEVDKNGENVEVSSDINTAEKNVSEPSGAQPRHYGVTEPIDPSQKNVPTKGQGAKDLTRPKYEEP